MFASKGLGFSWRAINTISFVYCWLPSNYHIYVHQPVVEDKPSYCLYHCCGNATVYPLWLYVYGSYSANPFSSLGKDRIRTPFAGSGSYWVTFGSVNLGGSVLPFWAALGANFP
jgi:hypothetical protein